MEKFTRHPRFIAAAYAVCLGLFACLLTLTLFKNLGLDGMLPALPSVLLTILIAASFGALYGKKLFESKTTKSSFLLGVGFLITILPFYDLGALFFINHQLQDTGNFNQNLKDYVLLYGLILVYSFIFVGSWLSIFCGVASVFFRKVFTKNTPQNA